MKYVLVTPDTRLSTPEWCGVGRQSNRIRLSQTPLHPGGTIGVPFDHTG